MKIISIGFKNPFQESGYTKNIKINNLDDINVFIGKNNSGKTNILRSIYNLLHQDINRSNIFRRLTVKLNLKDFELILEQFHNELIKIYKNPYIATPEANLTINRLKSTLKDGKFVNGFYPLFNLIKDHPIPQNFSMIFNFNNDIPNEKLKFDYTFDNINNLNEEIHKLIEDILKKVSLDQDLIKILIKHFLPFKKVILIPSFRTLEISEKEYQDGEIREITNSIATILDGSFDRIPINVQRTEPFKIPNLALMLSIIKEKQMIGEYKKIMNPEFFEKFNLSLRKIFPDINLYIDFKLTELTTRGGYQEYGKYMGDWTKLGNGTQQLISLLFLLNLPRNAIYLIDEPELGLHPGLQYRFISFVKEIILKNEKYSKQFFFATHSTCFIDFIEECSHFVCKKDKENFFIENLINNNSSELRNILGITPGYLLQKKGLIWVEGPSELFYIRAFLNCYNIDLEKENVLILPYNGNVMIKEELMSLEMMKSANPNFMIIMDSDFDPENNKITLGQKLEKIKDKFDSAGYTFYIIDKVRDIEGLIPQYILNHFFGIITPLESQNLKKPFEKLLTYINRIKTSGLKKPNYPKFSKDSKVKLAKSLLSKVKENEDYKQAIIRSEEIWELIKTIKKNINLWRNIEKPIDINTYFTSDRDLWRKIIKYLKNIRLNEIPTHSRTEDFIKKVVKKAIEINFPIETIDLNIDDIDILIGSNIGIFIKILDNKADIKDVKKKIIEKTRSLFEYGIIFGITRTKKFLQMNQNFIDNERKKIWLIRTMD